MYVPWAQLPDARSANLVQITPLGWIVRTRGEPYAMSIGDVMVLQSTARSDFNMVLLTIFAASALVLAAIGVYG
jgi:hypothetical protein